LRGKTDLRAYIDEGKIDHKASNLDQSFGRD
jgi:hypothetical protein